MFILANEKITRVTIALGKRHTAARNKCGTPKSEPKAKPSPRPSPELHRDERVGPFGRSQCRNTEDHITNYPRLVADLSSPAFSAHQNLVACTYPDLRNWGYDAEVAAVAEEVAAEVVAAEVAAAEAEVEAAAAAAAEVEVEAPGAWFGVTLCNHAGYLDRLLLGRKCATARYTRF